MQYVVDRVEKGALAVCVGDPDSNRRIAALKGNISFVNENVKHITQLEFASINRLNIIKYWARQPGNKVTL